MSSRLAQVFHLAGRADLGTPEALAEELRLLWVGGWVGEVRIAVEEVLALRQAIRALAALARGDA